LKIKGILILCFILFLGGCGPIPDDETSISVLPTSNPGEYAIVVDFAFSPVRNYHGTYLGRYDMAEIGRRLEELSKKHFPVKDYYLQEGQVLTSSRLLSLVRRESDSNPQGLNPPSGSQFDIGNGRTFVEDAIVIADVVELNFLGSEQDGFPLLGMSLAIVLNQQQRIAPGSSTMVSLSTERLYQYGSDVGRKLESYLRTLPNLQSIPIYIALYSNGSADATLPGHFIGDGYFMARSGQFNRRDEKWVLFPSNEASSLDSATTTAINGAKRVLQNMLPEVIGIVGKGRYVNEELNLLRISIHMSARTYTEIRVVTQMVVQLLDTFEQRNAHYIIEILSLSETFVIIERKPNENIPTVIYVH